jgi:excisionase family DNA binding protein
MDDKLLDISIVARRLNVSSQTVLRMVKDGKSPLKGVKVYRKGYKVYEESVKELLRQKEVQKSHDGE